MGLQERTGPQGDTWRAHFWMSLEHWEATSHHFRLDFTLLGIHQYYKMASLQEAN